MKNSIRLLFAVVIIPAALRAQTTDESFIKNGGFERGGAGWRLFVPKNLDGAAPLFDVVEGNPPEVHSGLFAARISSSSFARYGLATGFPLFPGKSYHISLWFKAEPGAKVQPDTPGLVIRLTIMKDGIQGANYFILPDGQVFQGKDLKDHFPSTEAVSLPAQWTKMEATLSKFPEEADKAYVNVFSWQTQGAILIDDVSITSE